MKSAYELAMERLGKQSPTVKLSAAQKKRLAELESIYKARVAEKELQLRADIARAAEAGEAETAQELERRWVAERKSLQEELEGKKDAIRAERN